MNKIAKSLIIVAAVAVVAGLGSYALWTDNESTDGNTITAGSLDLQVGGADLTGAPVITVANTYPGDTGTAFASTIDSAGTIAMSSVNLSAAGITDAENTLVDPEVEAGDTIATGELCGEVQVRVYADANNDGDLADAGDIIYDWGTLAGMGSLNMGALDAAGNPFDSRMFQIDYRTPATAGNDIMTDSCTFDLDFDAAQ